jgi:hypothetical protein
LRSIRGLLQELHGEPIGNNDVVSIRVEALGVSINIAIEQTKTELPVAASKAEDPATAERPSLPERLPEDVDNSAVGGDLGAENSAPVIDDFHRPSPPKSNGPTELPADGNPGTAVPASQTKPVWSDEEVETLRALYPTHSASAIATQLGRSSNSVKSKAQHLGLKKDGPPTVTSKPAPKPRSLSAAVTTDPVLTALPGFPEEDAVLTGSARSSGTDLTNSDTTLQAMPDRNNTVSLFDHHLGQSRWIVSDVWPVMYCGAPVVDCSSWCEQHSTRVFNPRPQGPAGISRRFQLKAWP